MLELKSEKLSISVDPQEGLRLKSFKIGGQERLATRSALPFVVGPHFGKRNPKLLGHEDPYPNGLAAYAPWEAELRGEELVATLKSDESTAEKQGFGFYLSLKMKILDQSIDIQLDTTSEEEGLAGVLFPFASGKGTLLTDSKKLVYREAELVPLPSVFQERSSEELEADLSQPFATPLYPRLDPLKGHLQTDAIQLEAHFPSQESSLYVQNEGGVLWMGGMTAQNPDRPTLTASSLRINVSGI